MRLRSRAGVLVLLALCLAGRTAQGADSSPAAGLSGQAFKDELQKAIQAQQKGEQYHTEIKSQIVKEAPPAVLSANTGDVSTTGLCAGDIELFCGKVVPGELRISKCLTEQASEEEKGNVEGKKLTDDCKKELAGFKADLGTNINKNIPLAEACAADSTKFCSDQDPKDPGAVLACLRDQKTELSATCQEQITETQVEAAKDFRTDADLAQACQADAAAVCKDVKAGEGRIQDCLRSKIGQTSWDCQEELFRQEVENADDVRLSYRLIRNCQSDKQKFCKDVKPGGARVKDCLEEHREDAEFSSECKAEFERMMQFRAADFRLDSSLREACAADIEDVCGYEKDMLETVEGEDARVITCLQDYREELLDAECKNQVHKLTQRASQDIRMDEPLADACYEDRSRLCVGVQPGSARVIRCLQDNREELGYECRATLFDQEVRMAEDIDFKYPMKRACTSEINKFCTGIPHGHANIIRCLQEHLEDEDMSGECREEVTNDQIRSNQDYRLNFRLATACDDDIQTLCAEECGPFMGQACGGRVLRCLTEKQDSIKNPECASEVFYFEKMEVNDFRNDVLLAEACRSDVDKFCKHTQPGEGRVHSCLREKLDQLTEGCRREELKLNIIQSRDIRLRPKLNKLCSEEIAVMCKDVKPGKGRVFKCLQENLGSPDFGATCKEQVEQRSSRMQEDYRLDYGVSSNCEADVGRVCAAEQGMAHGHAAVLKCLVNRYNNITDGCQLEMSRAVRMALWEYRPGAALTGMCDADVNAACGKISTPRSRGVWSIGAVGRCLSKQLAEGKKLEKPCAKLVQVAAPKDAQALFDSSMTTAAIAKKALELQQAAGIKAPLVNPEGTGASIITLTGWVALAALGALVTVIVAAVVFAYRRYTGMDQPYTIVTKEGDV